MRSLRELKPTAAKPAHKPLKGYDPGYLNNDVKYFPQMTDEEGVLHRYFCAGNFGRLANFAVVIAAISSRITT